MAALFLHLGSREKKEEEKTGRLVRIRATWRDSPLWCRYMIDRHFALCC